MNWLIAKAQAQVTEVEVVGDYAGYNLFADTSFWIAVGLVLFFGVVWRMGGFDAGMKALDDRVEKVKTELDEAEALRTEAQSLLAQYQRRHREAQREADDIIAQAREEANRMRAQAEEDLKVSLERRRAQAMERIARAEAQAVEEVKAAAVNIAVEASRAVIADKLAKDGEGALINQSIETLRSKLH